MNFELSTPALLFSAISLFMLAYTNRFLALAALIRQYIAMYGEHHESGLLRQIHNFEIRLKIIKYTQIAGVLSFLFCVLSMFMIFIAQILIAEIFFGTSLLLLFISLLLSLQELILSIGALKIEISKIKDIETNT
ncbi:MAG: DUF2721 domain-containing protein [Spirochaetales bacterium]|jgi:hypothetical protein|nr:DUF2721 domain-containing protein [Spirochaetales bacterium]